jgi:hypothetical protein
MNGRRTRLVRWTLFSLMIAALAFMVGCDKDDDDDNPTPSAPQTSEYSDDAANAWIQMSRKMVIAAGHTPPRAARDYGYLGQTIYESVVHGMPNHITLYGQIVGMPEIPATDPNLEYHWPSAVNKGSLEILSYLFADANPDVLAQATALFNDMHTTYAAEVSADVLTRSEGYGQLVASIIRVCADQDGYATNHNCAFTPPVGPGLWEPTPPAFVASPLEPCWGENRPFVLDNVDTECFPAAPPAYSEEPTSAFYTEMMEVYNTVNNATADQQEIALFWADGGGTSTPPGHWLNITNIVLNQTNGNLAQAAEIYCKVGLSVNDAFISCWRSKFEYNYVRPVTAIRDLVEGASEWLPPIVTPPFPECTSGHSTQSGAAYKVLEDFFGDVTFTDTTASATRPARTFDSFEDAAWEAAYSRLYGGIHFRTACESGVTQGECIGEAVKALQFRANS